MKIEQFFIGFALLVCVAQINCDDMDEKAMEECKKESKIDPKLADRIIKGEVPTEKDAKCFMLCVLVKLGIMDTAGKVHKDIPISDIPNGPQHDAAVADLNKCLETKPSADACETGFMIYKCLDDWEKKYEDSMKN